MQTIIIFFIWFNIFSELKNSVQNLEILGQHTPCSKGTTVLGGRFPQPAIMYNHFIKSGEPLLMKAVLEETNYTAFMQWTDSYWKKKYGDEQIGSWTDDSSEPTGIELSTFLEVYQDRDISVFDVIPEWMKDEVLIPPVLQCGGIQDNLHEPELFLSGGRVKTKLYYNDVDYFSCVLDGRQEFVLFDKKYKNLVEDSGWVEDGGYSQVDVEAVDKDRYPKLYDAPWQKANVSKGDCLLVPYGWYQHINSPPGRTLALSLKFSHLWWFDKKDCDGIDRDGPLKPLSQFKILDDIGELRAPFLSVFVNKSEVSKEIFSKKIDCGSTQLREQFWSYIDFNNDGSLSWPELYSFDMNYIQNKFLNCYKDYLPVVKQRKKTNKLARIGTSDQVTSEQTKTKQKKKVKTKVVAEDAEVKAGKKGKQSVVTIETDRETGKIMKDNKIEDEVSKAKRTEGKKQKDEKEKSDKTQSEKDKSVHDEF